MRAERWWQDASVVDQAFKNSGSFEFIQLTRLLRHVPETVPQQKWSENFNFTTSFSLNFLATEIEELSH